MHTVKCFEITVRFRSPSHQGQRISRNDGPTCTQYLRIDHDALRLHIAFIDKDGDTRQSINFNSAEVLEYSCEGYVK